MASLLPPEVLYQIASYTERFPSRQRDLWAMSLVSRSWYSAAISSLYCRPVISGRNFQLFVRTICPSINAHVRKTSFSSMIKELDMSRLVHDSCRSLTARILSRLKDGLEVFIAPRASFAVNCLAALSKCQHLRQLDLSLVTESIGLPWLLHSLRKLEHLEQLSIRCKDVVADNSSEVIWPPRLKALCVTGTFSDAVLDHFLSLPKALTSLTLYECRKLTLQPVKSLIKVLRDSLESLHVGRLKIQSEREDLVKWLEDLPRLKRLHACASWSFIPDDKPYYLSTSNFGTDNPHPLEYLEFDCSGVTESNDHEWGEIKYDLFWNLIDEGFLGNLRHVNWYHRRGVHLSKHATRIVRELDELLQALAREDGENARIKEEDAGAYIIWV